MLHDFPPSGTLGVLGWVLVLPADGDQVLGGIFLMYSMMSFLSSEEDFFQRISGINTLDGLSLGLKLAHMYQLRYLPQLWAGNHLEERDGNHESLERAQ